MKCLPTLQCASLFPRFTDYQRIPRFRENVENSPQNMRGYFFTVYDAAIADNVQLHQSSFVNGIVDVVVAIFRRRRRRLTVLVVLVQLHAPPLHYDVGVHLQREREQWWMGCVWAVSRRLSTRINTSPASEGAVRQCLSLIHI